LNLGIRSAWNVSGTESDTQYGYASDGKSYTGISEDGDNWVEAGTLTRLNTNLNAWAGKVIIIRFRVVIASDDNPYYGGDHYQTDPASAGFGGFFIDDVMIYGESLIESRTSGSDQEVKQYVPPSYNLVDGTISNGNSGESEDVNEIAENPINVENNVNNDVQFSQKHKDDLSRVIIESPDVNNDESSIPGFVTNLLHPLVSFSGLIQFLVILAVGTMIVKYGRFVHNRQRSK